MPSPIRGTDVPRLAGSPEAQEGSGEAGAALCRGEPLGWWQQCQGQRSHRVKSGGEGGETGISAHNLQSLLRAHPSGQPGCWGGRRWGKGGTLLRYCWSNVLAPSGTSGGTVGAAASCLSLLSPRWRWLGHPRTPDSASSSPPSPCPRTGEGAAPVPSTAQSPSWPAPCSRRCHLRSFTLARWPWCPRTWSAVVLGEGWLESPGSTPALPSPAARGGITGEG